jgi:undecaprenyldiphospho-muramoylpentapeptide beta-N-acetylglucosaminyltransferase
MSRRRVEIVITGGGTAGHVLPALAVARALVAGGRSPDRIRFVGAKRGMEAHLVPAAGFRVTLLPGRGIVRRLSLDNVAAVAGLCLATCEAFVLLAMWRPRAVMMVGGFAGAPTTLAAALLRVPIVVVNIDAVPGAANRLASRVATVCAVALPGTPIRRAVVSGVPLRPEVLAARERAVGDGSSTSSPAATARAAARAELGLPAEAFIVAVTGGSLGARRLNDAAVELAGALAASRAAGPEPAGEARSVAEGGGRAGPAAGGRPPLVYHVTGQRDHTRVTAAASAAGLGADLYRAVAFEERMPQLLLACDVLVSRAGASTVAEICALGVPSVLVPLPNAPSDHQRRNAEVPASAGGAILLEDQRCTGELLGELIAGLLADPARLEAMGRAAAALGRPDAATRVAELIERAAAGRSLDAPRPDSAGRPLAVARSRR